MPEPQIHDGKDGRVALCVDEMNVPLPHSGGSLLITELWYECVAEERACFDILKGSIRIANSPEADRPLPAGFSKCPEQKKRDPQTLCLNICIPVRPGGPSFDDLKREVEAQIRRAQEIFDENIQICCPKIQIKPCINELSWAEYSAIVAGGEQADILEQYIYGAGQPETDGTKDQFDLSGEVKALLKKCRKPDCISIYYVPQHRYKSGGAWHDSNGCSISPNDFPVTTGAEGSGPGLIITQGLPLDANTLIHELGHMLIDRPRTSNLGEEHCDDRLADRVMKPKAPAGRRFTQSECRFIFTNIASYQGDCS